MQVGNQIIVGNGNSTFDGNVLLQGTTGEYLVIDDDMDFYPPKTVDAVEPTVAANAVRIWDDTAGNYYLIYGSGSGNVKVALT